MAKSAKTAAKKVGVKDLGAKNPTGVKGGAVKKAAKLA
jgi:hypothetical protein